VDKEMTLFDMERDRSSLFKDATGTREYFFQSSRIIGSAKSSALQTDIIIKVKDK